MPVLHIDVDAGQEHNLERWSAARRDISTILENNGYLNLEVEIEDPHRSYQPSFYAIHPANAAVRVYRAARNELLTRIFDSIGSAWELLSVFEVGRTANVKKPTVVLIVEPLALYDWKMLKESLDTILDRYGEDLPKLSVEIVPGAAGHPRSGSKEQEQDVPGLSFLDDFNTHPRHGTSIGVQGEKGGGTLGGFFKMVSPFETHIGFLTSSHVVAPPANASSSERLQYDTMGLPYHKSQAEGTKIQYFAEKDVETSIAKGHQNIQRTKDYIQAQKNREKERHERGQANEQTRSMLQNVILDREELTEMLKKDIAKAMEMPRLYGRTILAPGKALNSQLMTLDYAFVETPSVSKIRSTPFPPQ